MDMPGIGIVFVINDFGGGYYGYQAWRIFMRYVEPKSIPNTLLREGDTHNTLHGKDNDFCIAVYGPTLDCDYIFQKF